MRPDPDIVDKNGKPIDVEELTRLLADPDYRRVGLTEAAPGFWVSTVWLGVNQGGGAFEPPLYFETMIRRVEDDSRDWLRMRQRYTTLTEAEAGHLAACELVTRIYRPGMSARDFDLAWIADAGLVSSES